MATSDSGTGTEKIPKLRFTYDINIANLIPLLGVLGVLINDHYAIKSVEEKFKSQQTQIEQLAAKYESDRITALEKIKDDIAKVKLALAQKGIIVP